MGPRNLDEVFPVLQVLLWLRVQEARRLNSYKYVWVSDYLYFLCLLVPFFQRSQARIISWGGFRETVGISEAFEGGIKTREDYLR